MAKHDPRIDTYIANAAPFAQPILARLRALVHDALPDVEEDMKWGSPHFLHHGMLAREAPRDDAGTARPRQDAALEVPAGDTPGRDQTRDTIRRPE